MASFLSSKGILLLVQIIYLVECNTNPSGVCPVGTIYNSNSKECVSSSNLPECPIYQNVPLYFPHEQCNKYWVCFMGVLTELSCPDKLEWDDNRKICDWPKADGCSSKTSTTQRPTTPAPTTPEATTPPETTMRPTTPPPTTPRPTTTEATTPPETTIRHTTAPPTTPRPTTTEATTPPETTMRPTTPPPTTPRPTTTEATTPPETTIRHTTAPPTTPRPTTTEATTPPETTMRPTTPPPTTPRPTTTEATTPPQSTTAKPQICPSNSTDIVLIPHESNCTKFYICFNGIATEYECANGMEFDAKLLQCVPIIDDGCSASSRPKTPVKLDMCGYFMGLLSHPNDCSKFIDCSNLGTINSCPVGMEFNPENQKCNFISLNGCTAGFGNLLRN